MAAIAEEGVERAIRRGRDSSYEEFRSRPRDSVAVSPETAFWKYATARPMEGFSRYEGDHLSPYLFEEREHRVLSKATSAAGGYLVPSDFDAQITRAWRGNERDRRPCAPDRDGPRPRSPAWHGDGARRGRLGRPRTPRSRRRTRPSLK